ncbi:MAG TPA: hypothetical protein V6C85_38240 [Allocoleopsis sp.]
MKTSTLLKISTGLACSLVLGSFLSSSALSLSASFNSSSPKSHLTNPSESLPPVALKEKQLRPAADTVNLNGKWKGNDGAIYYIRRVGSQVWWYGENSPTNPSFSNVFRANFAGSIKTGSSVVGQWADVPKGTILQGGNLSFKVVNPNLLQRVDQTGNFSGSTWTRI